MAVTSYTFPGSVRKVSGNNWATLNNILADDGNLASSSASGLTTEIRLEDFGFAIPSTATIDGIEIEYENQTPSGPQDTEDFAAQKGGVVQTAPYTSQATSRTLTVRTLGGATSLWNATWTPADINAIGTSGFGFSIFINGLNFTTGHSFDYLKARIYYTDSGGGGTTYNDTLTESVTVADSLANAATFANALSEAITAGQTWANAVTFASALAEALTVSDSYATAATFPNTLGESITLGYIVSNGNVFNDTLTESVTLAQTFANAATWASALSEAITLADSLATVATFGADLAEALSLGDSYEGTGGTQGSPWVTVGTASTTWTPVTTASTTWTRQ